MTYFLTRRLLVNIAVVLVALGGNAFVACEQISGQREADARTLRSMSLMRDLDAYRSALGEDLTALGRFEATGALEAPARHEARIAHVDALESSLRAQFAIEPGMDGAFDALARAAAVMKRDSHSAFERAMKARPGALRDWVDALFAQMAEDQRAVDEESR
jgi:hypothetical protein